MTGKAEKSLLSLSDPPPARVSNSAGTSQFLLIGDHAGNLVPSSLGDLGISAGDLNRHIGLDIGISELGHALSQLLDATFIEQRYSRLVVDCNRAKNTTGSVIGLSDRSTIFGNLGLTASDITRRYAEIFEPYHAAIARELAGRASQGRDTILIALHSFTPTLGSQERPWDVGVLHDGGSAAFALLLLAALRQSTAWIVGDNEPYRMDETDFTVPAHAYPHGINYAEIEVRQDHLSSEPKRRQFAAALAPILMAAADAMPGSAKASRSVQR